MNIINSYVYCTETCNTKNQIFYFPRNEWYKYSESYIKEYFKDKDKLIIKCNNDKVRIINKQVVIPKILNEENCKFFETKGVPSKGEDPLNKAISKSNKNLKNGNKINEEIFTDNEIQMDNCKPVKNKISNNSIENYLSQGSNMEKDFLNDNLKQNTFFTEVSSKQTILQTGRLVTNLNTKFNKTALDVYQIIKKEFRHKLGNSMLGYEDMYNKMYPYINQRNT